MLWRCTFLTIITALAFQANAQADSPDGPYKAIVERNIFGLNPPPPPQTNNPAADQAPANIKFTGITTLGGEKKAWFIVQGRDAKDPPTYLSLPEGERSGVIEVLQINDGAGEVKVATGGREIVLNFKDNGNKANAVAIAPPPPVPGMGPMGVPGRAIPGVPPPPGGTQPLPGATSIPPPPAPAFNRGGVAPALNSNIPAPPGMDGAPQPTSPALRTIPTRTLRTPKQ